MSYITTQDGTQIFYKDWGKGQPVVFSHGWPLSADAFEDQMFFLASKGYRAITDARRGPDRRRATGHGEKPGQSRRHADGGVRSDTRRGLGRPLAVLEGPQHAVLWLQSTGSADLGGGARV